MCVVQVQHTSSFLKAPLRATLCSRITKNVQKCPFYIYFFERAVLICERCLRCGSKVFNYLIERIFLNIFQDSGPQCAAVFILSLALFDKGINCIFFEQEEVWRDECFFLQRAVIAYYIHPSDL